MKKENDNFAYIIYTALREYSEKLNRMKDELTSEDVSIDLQNKIREVNNICSMIVTQNSDIMNVKENIFTTALALCIINNYKDLDKVKNSITNKQKQMCMLAIRQILNG